MQRSRTSLGGLLVCAAVGLARPEAVPLGRGGAVVDLDGGHLPLSGGGRIGLALVAFGREHDLRRVRRAAPTIGDAEVRVARGPGLVEWWRPVEVGLEHGVDVASAPPGEGEVVLDLAVSGAVEASAETDDTIALREPGGRRVATYAALTVVDARGDVVPSSLAVVNGRVRIRIDDRSARYPLVVDPVLAAVQEAELVGRGSTNRFGSSVAISDDGSTLVVGEAYRTVFWAEAGRAEVFSRSGSTWTFATGLDTPAGRAGGHFGHSAEISASGDRVLVGEPFGGTSGSVYVFSRVAGAYALSGTLTDATGLANDQFGYAIALDDAGLRAVVGAPYADTTAGADAGRVYVYSLVGPSPVLVGTLEAPVGGGGDRFGEAVAISGDGTRLAVGAGGDDTPRGLSAGTVCVYWFDGTSWAFETTLEATDGAADDHFGQSLALSSDASRILVGAPADDAGEYDNGTARVFRRSGTTWTAEATLVTSMLSSSIARLSSAVAWSSDASVAFLGAEEEDTAGGGNAGLVRVFLRTGTTWTEDARIAAPGGAAGDRFGGSLSVTPDASRLAVGAREDDVGTNTRAGTARVFTLAMAAPVGAPCSAGSACASGVCADGVCCATACGSGSGDCLACAASWTGGADGTCAPITAGTVCRVAGSACALDATCDGVGSACPPNTAAPATTPCRPVAGPCDVAELCDGTATTCPADAVAAAGSPCRAAAGACDVDDVCDGLVATCVDGRATAGTVCRASTAGCDPEESCDGMAPACPLDVSTCAMPDAGPGPDGGLDAGADDDAGAGLDAGALDDAGAGLDAGTDDDAGALDAGGDDAGAVGLDGGADDAGGGDAGDGDAGASDAGPRDAAPDAVVAGDAGPAMASGGCSCGVASREPGSAVAVLASLALALARRRRRARA